MSVYSEAGSRGGKVSAAKVTPEERKRRGKKAARTLGKEGRSARAAKGWATRKERLANQEAALSGLTKALVREGALREVIKSFGRDKIVGDEHLTPPDPYIYDEATGQPIGTIKPIDGRGVFVVPTSRCAMGAECTHPDCNAVPPKAKRPMRQRVLEAMGRLKSPNESGIIAEDIRIHEQDLNVADAEVRNALSSLRTGGHVVSEGTGKAKLWRQA